jgi:hypothetical protein
MPQSGTSGSEGARGGQLPRATRQKPYELETLVGKIRDAIGSRSLSGPDRGSDS